MTRATTLITVLGLSLLMLVAGAFVVASASAQMGGAANQIVVRSQDTNAGQIVVDTVIAAQDGWLVVYTNTSLSPSAVIGWVPVHKGVNTNLKVNIDSGQAEPLSTLWAVLHVDRGAIGQLELPVIDGAVQENGQTVMVAFGTQAPPVVEPTAQAPQVVSTSTAVALATAQVPQAVIPAVSAGTPQALPPAGAEAAPSGWLALAGLGGLLAMLGLVLPRVRAGRL